MDSRALLSRLRIELQEVNRRIENHPFIVEAENAVLPLDKLKLYVENQYYIVYHDVRSLALMVSRAKEYDEATYLAKLELGDLRAFEELCKMGEELGVGLTGFERLRIIPAAVSYTHYLSWLALNASVGEQVFALIVNLPVWGRACARLAEALKTRYGLAATGFLEGFAQTPPWVEDDGLRLVERYLDRGEEKMRLVARMIQSYELSFWDGIYGGA
ncbi:MAG: TenA family transcriptional regulator [Nitrososphaerota archaeon]